MPNQPPYTISLKTADYLAKIVETVTRLEVRTDWGRDIRLHRKNRVRSIYSSLAIEGNTLSLDEVADVIDGKPVAGKQEEIKEVKNAFQAYDKILTFDPYNVKDLLKAHKLMTDGLVKEAGKFRSGDVGVFDGDAVIHIGARPQFVPELIDELFVWAKDTELHPVIKSAVVHSEIETIHPFADGNGRMGRLWQTLILAKWNSIFTWIPMESLVYEKRPEYYDALHAAQQTNDSGVFIEFALSVLLDTVEMQAQQQAEAAASKSDGIKDGIKDGINEVQQSILTIMSENPRITIEALAAELGINKRNTEKNVKALKDAGRIMRIGARKNGHWKVGNN